MSGDESPRTSLFRELKDRKVFRSLAFYAVVGWGAIEVSETTFPLLDLPAEGPRIITILVLLGFPIVLAGAWFFDLVPDRGSAKADSDDGAGSRRLAPPKWAMGGILLGASGVAAVAVVAALHPPLISSLYWDSRLDPDLLVVFPFSQRDVPGSDSPDADVVEWQLAEELSRWRGVSLVDRFHVVDALHRHGVEGGTAPSSESAVDAARELGAGRLVMGEVVGIGDSLSVRVAVLNAATGEVVVRSSARAASEPGSLRGAFRRLGAELLGLSVPGEDLEPGSTSSLEAARSYVAGRVALERGDGTEARRLLRQAIEADPEYPEANLWLARVRAWSGEESRLWLENARRSVREEGPATPLLALAHEQWPEACAGFRRIVEENAEDVPGWIGLAECLHRDDAVLPDPGSPSGWSFRTSHHSAALAYREAMRRARFLTPILYERLRMVLPDRQEKLRGGISHVPGADLFRAYPELHSDTVAWIPHPSRELRSGTEILSPSVRQATQWGRGILLEEVRAWAEAYPRSPAAWLALASVLEEQGRLSNPRDTLSGALEAVERALREARQPSSLLRGELLRVRVLLKAGETSRAVRRADSLLRAWPRPPETVAENVAAVAALRGLVEDAAGILSRRAASVADERAVQGGPELPTALLAERERFRAYMTSGGHAEIAGGLETRIREMVRSAVAPADEERVLQELLDNLVAAAPIGDPHPLERPDAPNGVLALRWHYHRGDTARVRSTLDRWGAGREAIPPGRIAPRQVMAEVEMRLLLGDTATARESLRRFLRALPTMSAGSFGTVEDAFALTRGFSLAARLEEAAGEPEEAARWARVAATLRTRREEARSH